MSSLHEAVPFDLVVEFTHFGPSVSINGQPVWRVTEPVNGPVMIEHPLVRIGRPVSILDVLGASRLGMLIEGHERLVPADRDFGRLLTPSTGTMGEWELVPTRRLHEEFLGQLRWRGRPCAFTKFTFDTLRTWRDEVFSGKLTIREVAELAHVSEPAAARFAHGETLWYI